MFLTKVNFRIVGLVSAAFLLLFWQELWAGGGEDSSGTSPSQLYLVVAGERDHQVLFQKVEELVNRGADVNFISIPESGVEGSILSEAVDRQSYDLVKFLLDNGANPNPVHKIGCTPFGKATTYRSKQIAELLISRGVDLSKPSCYGVGRSERSSLEALLLSTLILDESLFVRAVENYNKAGHRWASSLLRSMIRRKNSLVLKRMIELQPDVLGELEKDKIRDEK